MGGILNIVISALHFLAMFRLEEAFVVTGVAGHMAEWAALSPAIPYILTAVVAVIFFIFGLYGLSGAGVIRKLPLLKTGVFAIAAVYILRGAGYLVYDIVSGNTEVFLTLFSLTALGIGCLYLFGGLHEFNRG